MTEVKTITLQEFSELGGKLYNLDIKKVKLEPQVLKGQKPIKYIKHQQNLFIVCFEDDSTLIVLSKVILVTVELQLVLPWLKK